MAATVRAAHGGSGGPVLDVLKKSLACNVFEDQENSAFVEVDVVNHDEVRVRGQRGQQTSFGRDLIDLGWIGRVEARA